MKANLHPHRKRVLSRVRAVARKARKQVKRLTSDSRPRSRNEPADPTLLALKREYARILSEIQQQEVLTQDHPSSGNHMADDATEVFEQTKNLALKEHLEQMLKQVERAMHRIEQGTYGICESCGALINPDRLNAMPYATLCLGCAKTAVR